MTLRRPHDCVRCGKTIDPGEEFGAVDVLDPAGELRVLLCVDCAEALRTFLGGTDNGGADGATETPE
ncbi:hypothetical protein [Halopenitus persicus]|uniref:Uncharacterized protein n=1 Tax=Halopenitus persicus TaxID=1048396 RepID=A0A1H3KSN0_9EURY|nr:hypothetical protein [Halopenitus persicus]SDY55172.1 hypothetical protein SAMN05216564_106140 [Halopenitus persicus]